jgi:serine/threonine protein kinase
MNKYQIIKSIGDGTYGQVYEGINIETNEKVAIKKLKNKMSSWEECILQNEIRFLRKLDNENIIKLIEVIREANSDVSYIFELCDCNLFEFIEKHRKQKMFISEAKIRNIVYQITCGIKYLHSFNIMHRDLKPENILMKLNNNLIKLADFGTAKEVPQYKDNSLTDYVCTRWYRAPECTLKSNNYDEKIDIWAIGCIMAELYTLKPIFPGIDEFDQLNRIIKVTGTPEFNDWPEGFALVQKLNIRMPNYNKGNLKQIVFNANDDAIDFLEYIFQLNPEKRPTAADLLKHPYFTEVQRPGSYSYQMKNMRGRINKNYNDVINIKTLDNKFNDRENKRNMFSITDSIIKNINNNPYNNNHLNNKEDNFFKFSYERNKDATFPQKLNGFRSSYRTNTFTTNQNEQQNEISKNNYNYYKNFNFSNYVNNNGALPDIDSVFRNNLMNLNNNNAYNKYNNDNQNDNLLLNSYTQSHNNKFSSYAKNEIMQNINKDKYYSANRRNVEDANQPMNQRIFGNISPFPKERLKKGYYDLSNNNAFPNIYNNYGQIF